ncbi:MAG: hypothetical protein Q9213_003820 [Squamulea squamosa]
MGWFSGWFSSSDSSSSKDNNDPLRNLDPTLRDFLEKESPVKYQTSAPPPGPPATQAALEPTSQQTSTNDATSTTPVVPLESLYQDGRYAHLWSTYKSRGEVEAATKSDQEKLMDVLEGYKSRKAMIGKAALENCALEQAAISDCYRSGSLASKMTMCREENGAFNRCYTMQARFLKALGYLSAHDRPLEIDERIQMHADKLYHRMLDQERAIEEAKKSNLPIPEFPPLVTEPVLPPNPVATSRSTTSSSTGHTATTSKSTGYGATTSSTASYGSTTSSATHHGSTDSTLKDHPAMPSPDQTISTSAQPMSHDESKEMYLKRILPPEARAAQEKEWDRKGLSSEEKMLEARAMAMEAEAGLGVADQVGKIMQETKKGKEERRRQGTAGLGDTISGWLGW